MSLLETSTSVSGDSQTTDAIALCPYSRVRAIVTRVHAARLEAILQNLAEHANGEKCQGMQGLIDEAFECVNAAGADEVRDAGLVGAAHRIEHYEMAGYSAARSLALKIGDETAADLMRSTLNEECEADELLLSVAESIGVAEKKSDFAACDADTFKPVEISPNRLHRQI